MKIHAYMYSLSQTFNGFVTKLGAFQESHLEQRVHCVEQRYIKSAGYHVLKIKL